MNEASKMRVAVIGCGPAGISALAAFDQAEKKGERIPEVVCFEKQEKIGGIWNYSWRTGVDEHGEICHNGMYKGLWANAPKEFVEMGDYTFEEHFGHQIPSYSPLAVLKDYLLGKAKKNDIQRFVQLNTIVRNVEERDDQFLVSTYNQKTKQGKHEIFDYVIVATGHFSIPKSPDFPGVESFPGTIMHSHDFRDTATHHGKKILLIGNHYSGQDLALQCYKSGIKDIIISYKRKSTGYKWPTGIVELPLMQKYEEGKFHFADGSTHEADVVIFCTGYMHHFPFMSGKLRLHTTNTLYPEHLYKGVLLDKNLKVIYLGMQDLFWTWTMFEAQAWYARDYILGKIVVDTKELVEDYDQWMKRLHKIDEEKDEEIDFQRDYVKDLLKFTDCHDDQCDKKANIGKQYKREIVECVTTYRDTAFASVFTGKMAPKPKLPWMENMDASLESFLDYNQD